MAAPSSRGVVETLEDVFDFAQIQDAFDAAAPGDIIHVHSNAYMPATTDKGVALLANNGGFIGGEIAVENLPAGQTFAIEGFNGPFRFTARNCQGAVHIEGISTPWTEASMGNGRDWIFEHCALVSINNSSM